ncbi:hypothetical protein [Endozoicomonas sp. 8E]|uniref:hypothetical protein n=1 Tax=Endozoicomonas sp. 8E TaxID=3035692 RepID=UPI0029394E12|nr:hypothetical protein [Endozoicomonas sp. 8E]WOG26779.1 hypothetical protein P6910_19850 [Endozoicomonas sp. 8E]
MQIGNPMAQSLAVGQPVSTPANASNRGLFQGIRETFLTYDPVNGTRRKLIPSLALMAGAASAGAVSLDTLVKNWTPFTAPAGAALADRVITVLENTVQRHPWVCGAAAGAATALVGLNMLAGSMKPVARECIETAMEGLRHQLHRDFHEITVLKELIAQHQKKMSELKPLLSEEKARYKRHSQKAYENRLAEFRQEANSMAGHLKGYVDGLLSSGRSNRRNVLRGDNPAHLYRAGVELERFVSKENQDYSFLSQRQLLDALKPVLSEDELKRVKIILRNFPVKPSLFVRRGPIAREYAEIREQNASDQREVGELQSKIRKVLAQYPNLNPDAAGNIPKPPAKEFGRYMPE